MNEKKHETAGPETFVEMWMKTTAEFWESTYQMWSGDSDSARPLSHAEETAKNRAFESIESTLKTWKALSGLMKEPEALESMLKGIAALPELVSKMTKPAMEGYLHLQRELLERAGRIGKSTAAYKFENLDQEAFKAWLEVYENEFKKFLNIPQLGLTRGYQERFTQAADKFNVFQATLAEFVSLLYLPVEKSFKVVQDQLSVMADQGKVPERSKEFYRLWVRVLEGHYMTLFKSPEYNQALSRILNAFGEYNVAKQQILQDAMQTLPVPTLKEMDELYKEIYLLKKRVRELENKMHRDFETTKLKIT
jgi:polyhydroxyalkanoate synthase subunit PhaE